MCWHYILFAFTINFLRVRSSQPLANPKAIHGVATCDAYLQGETLIACTPRKQNGILRIEIGSVQLVPIFELVVRANGATISPLLVANFNSHRKDSNWCRRFFAVVKYCIRMVVNEQMKKMIVQQYLYFQNSPAH